jgi:hypothetical protein
LITLPLKPRTLAYVLPVLLIAGGITVWAVINQPAPAFYITLGWLLIIAALLWWGNRFLTRRLDRVLTWNRWGNFRFFLHLSLGLLYLLILVNLTYLILKLSLTTDPPTVGQVVTTNIWGAFIFIPLFSIYFSLHFLKHWRKSELETERMQKENIRTQLNSLKNQLDPHFLFNNLNILAALLDTDVARSKRFVENFSDVYRTLLKRRTDDLVPLSEELEFIDAYMFLLRTRFDQLILFTTNLKPESANRMIPPLTLQLLIENAVKHNVIRETSPLAIQLLQLDNDYLIVSNTLNELPSPGREREGSGLANIRSRYTYFTEKPVNVIRTSTHFEVHIPLLEIERP